MKTYLLSIYQPDGEPPAPELLQPVMQKMHALLGEMKAGNVWVFNGGLHGPSSASVVRVRNDEPLITDGPYIEGKEHIGGFVVVRVADLDAALDWANKLASALTLPGAMAGLPVEVRPFQHAEGST